MKMSVKVFEAGICVREESTVGKIEWDEMKDVLGGKDGVWKTMRECNSIFKFTQIYSLFHGNYEMQRQFL